MAHDHVCNYDPTFLMCANILGEFDNFFRHCAIIQKFTLTLRCIINKLRFINK